MEQFFSWVFIVAALLLAMVSAFQIWGGRPHAVFSFVEIPAEPDLVVLGCEIVNPPPLRFFRLLRVVRSVEERAQILFAVYKFDSNETLTGEPLDPVLLRPDREGGVEVRSPVRLVPNESLRFTVLMKVRGTDTCRVMNPDGSDYTLGRGAYRVEVVAVLQSVPRILAAARAVNVGTKTMGWGDEMSPQAIQTVRPHRVGFARRRYESS